MARGFERRHQSGDDPVGQRTNVLPADETIAEANEEIRMSNVERSTNDDRPGNASRAAPRYSDFGLRHSFGICHLSFVICH
jgi:hypothetical protein